MNSRTLRRPWGYALWVMGALSLPMVSSSLVGILVGMVLLVLLLIAAPDQISLGARSYLAPLSFVPYPAPAY